MVFLIAQIHHSDVLRLMSNILYGYSRAQKTLKVWKKKGRKSKEKLVRRKKEQNRDKRRKLLRNSRNSNTKGQRGLVLKKKTSSRITFSEQELAKFTRRYENGYDIATDERYNAWLRIFHLTKGKTSVPCKLHMHVHVPSNYKYKQSGVHLVKGSGAGRHH